MVRVYFGASAPRTDGGIVPTSGRRTRALPMGRVPALPPRRPAGVVAALTGPGPPGGPAV
jgi:hypothetical protein